MYKRVLNFSAGPATLPLEVLEIARDEIINYQNSGMSVMEMSHRSKTFLKIIESTEEKLRRLLKVNEDYFVTFFQGGASMQFAMLPINFSHLGPMEVVHTGFWTKKAIAEMERVGETKVIASSEDKNFSYIPEVSSKKTSNSAAFYYICSNNTICGTRFIKFPKVNSPLVADMSSEILSREINVSDFDLIFAGAQKNMGPAGVAIVIAKKNFLEKGSKSIPAFLQYRTQAEAKSLYNTPTSYTIYLINLILDWLEKKGGVEVIEKINNEKAHILYSLIDKNDFYSSPILNSQDRSVMNVVFRINGGDEKLEKKFIFDAEKVGLSGLKGHRNIGGLRASIYNAMPKEGVKTLRDFMIDFANKNG